MRFIAPKTSQTDPSNQTTALPVSMKRVIPASALKPSPLSSVSYPVQNGANTGAYIQPSKYYASHQRPGKENYLVRTPPADTLPLAQQPQHSNHWTPSAVSSFWNWDTQMQSLMASLLFRDRIPSSNALEQLDPLPTDEVSPCIYDLPLNSHELSLYSAPLKHLSGTTLKPSLAQTFARPSLSAPTAQDVDDLMTAVLDSALPERDGFQAAMGLVLLSRLGLTW
jgi:hypothetical protein